MQNTATVINNVNIVDVENKQIAFRKSIHIDSGRIMAVDDYIETSADAVNVIDAEDAFVMPGLVNMHTHLGDNRNDLILYLANGVTTIRNMWGYGKFSLRQWLFGTRVFNHLVLRQKIEDGEVIGPTIFTAGPLLDGAPPFFPGFMSVCPVTEEQQIEQVVRMHSSNGYDFVKVYSGLSIQSFDNIIAYANRYDLPVAGHVPDLVGIEHVIRSGIRSIEHLYGFINPYAPEQNIPKEDIPRLAALAVRFGVWNCPTLVANERLANIERQRDFEDEDQMKYISSMNKRGMRMLIKAADKLFRDKGVKGNHSYMDTLFHIVRVLRDEGAGILLGTDKSVPYVVAGFSEHAEMKLLSQAGLSNAEVIQAATIDAARCLGNESDFGSIENGKKADLIFTRENPFHDLHTIFHHDGVMKNGILYSRETCDEMLRSIM